jgi:uncharacterized membrane protein
MTIDNRPEGPSLSTFTHGKAVFLGHLLVSVPVVVIMAVAFMVGYILRGMPVALIYLFIGVLLAWLWWSTTVPRWKRWTKHRGADEERTRHLAQQTGLVWPKGSFLEKSEFRRRDEE